MGYIGIVDYGAGNLMSVSNSLNFLGLENKIVTTPELMEGASGIILPGVGSISGRDAGTGRIRSDRRR